MLLLNKIFTCGSSHLIHKLLPNHIHHSFTKVVRIVDVFTFFLQNIKIRKLLFQFRLKALLQGIKANIIIESHSIQYFIFNMTIHTHILHNQSYCNEIFLLESANTLDVPAFRSAPKPTANPAERL